MLKHTRLVSMVAAGIAMISFALPVSLHAHQVWIEDTPDGRLFVRFAEFGSPYEKSPGPLDRMTAPVAWIAGAEQLASAGAAGAAENEAAKAPSFDVQKKEDGFLIGGAKAEQSVQVETGFHVMGKVGDAQKPARKPFFYARWQPAGLSGAANAQPSANFDLVPAGSAGKVRVYFRGKPLPGAKVTLFPPAGEEQALTSDAEGYVQFEASKAGLYLLTASGQREATPGYFAGKPFEVTSHSASLAWRQK